jgi:hypothetical protein
MNSQLKSAQPIIGTIKKANTTNALAKRMLPTGLCMAALNACNQRRAFCGRIRLIVYLRTVAVDFGASWADFSPLWP